MSSMAGGVQQTNNSTKRLSSGFSHVIDVLLGTVNASLNSARRRVIVSLFSMIFLVSGYVFNFANSVAVILTCIPTVYVLLVSAWHWYLASEAKGIFEFKNEMHELYREYVSKSESAESLKSVSSSKLLPSSKALAKFAYFIYSSFDASMELKSRIFLIMKLFNPLNLFLFLTSVFAFYIQLILLMIVVSSSITI